MHGQCSSIGINNFIIWQVANRLVMVKSSDLTSDRVNDSTDSKPYNNTGIHFKKQVAILLRRLRESDQPSQNVALLKWRD